MQGTSKGSVHKNYKTFFLTFLWNRADGLVSFFPILRYPSPRRFCSAHRIEEFHLSQKNNFSVILHNPQNSFHRDCFFSGKTSK